MKNLFTKSGHRILSLIVTAAIIMSGIPISAAGADYADVDCIHEHDAAVCGYIESAPCQHEHDGDCGYTEAESCTHECGEDCAEPCTHEHDEGCYIDNTLFESEALNHGY